MAKYEVGGRFAAVRAYRFRGVPPRAGRIRLGLAILVAGLGFIGRLAAQATFNPATDFSAASNPGGSWSYGYANSPGGFTLFGLAGNFAGGVPAWRNSNVYPASYPTVFYNASGSAVVYNATLTIPAGMFGLHPGDTGSGQVYSIARLTLAAAGDYRLDASYVGLETYGGGTTSDVLVFINGAGVFAGSVTGFGQTASLANHVFTATVGTVVDFLVGNGGNGFTADTTGLTASVVAVPEAASAGALLGAGAGIGALVAQRLRRRKLALRLPEVRGTLSL